MYNNIHTDTQTESQNMPELSLRAVSCKTCYSWWWVHFVDRLDLQSNWFATGVENEVRGDLKLNESPVGHIDL